MNESMNVWGIKEYDGDGASCPIVAANLPWHKKLVLTFFRFGVCPACVTLSVTYAIGRYFKKVVSKVYSPVEKKKCSQRTKLQVNYSSRNPLAKRPTYGADT